MQNVISWPTNFLMDRYTSGPNFDPNPMHQASGSGSGLVYIGFLMSIGSSCMGV